MPVGKPFGLWRARLMAGQNRGATVSITCKATIRLICEYLEGRLAPEVAGEVQRHLSYCPNCRTIFDAAALTLEVYFDREVEPVPADRTRVA